MGMGKWVAQGKKLLPFLLCAVVILIAQTPGVHVIFTGLVAIPIFWFAIFNPNALNAYAVFTLGLFADVIGQTPLGIYSFLFVLLFFVARLNRLFLKELSFKSLWMLFAVCSGLMILLQYFLFSLCVGVISANGFLLFQYVTLTLLYPLGVAVCGRLNKSIEETGV